MKAVDSKAPLDIIKECLPRLGHPEDQPAQALIENLDTLPMPAWIFCLSLRNFTGSGRQPQRLPARRSWRRAAAPTSALLRQERFRQPLQDPQPQYIMKMITILYHQYE